MDKSHPFRIFGVSASITILAILLVALTGNWTSVWVCAVLILLEVTFSFDNAVINSRVLRHLSPFWQTMFLTVGIFIAVFVIRFLLPIVLVAVAGHRSFGDVVTTALYDPRQYADLLHAASPIIDAFGGFFLLMVACYFFGDREKKIDWIAPVESRLRRYTQNRIVIFVAMTLLLAMVALQASQEQILSVIISGIVGVLLFTMLHIVSGFAAHKVDDPSQVKSRANIIKVGRSAFMSFIYLEVLDASFSLDSVVGAFAITPDILLIMIGLGVGAIWVRSMTVYFLRVGTLEKNRYLEHGAHWAIFLLGCIMIGHLFGFYLPEYIIGSAGICIIGASLVSSKAADSKDKRLQNNLQA